jgi:hypothetical protein
MITDITAPIAIGQSSDNYTLVSADGFGTPSVETVKWRRPGFHGIKVPRAFYRERVIRLVIQVRAENASTYESKRRDLLEAFDLPRDGLTNLKFETNSGLKLQTEVQLNSEIQAPLRAGEVTIGRFRIELVAEDPVLYSQTENEEDITFADGSGTITNSGNCPVFPEVRIYGNVQNPSVKNDSLGRTVSLSGITIASGDYFDIDMLNETVEDSGLASQYEYIDDDDFWWLENGDNDIVLGGTAGGLGHRKVTIIYRDGYLGV